MPEVKRGISPAVVLIPVGLGLGLTTALIVAVARAAPPEGGRRPPCGDYGDVDGDGWVTLKDAELLAQHIVGKIELTAEQLARADVDGDGVPTITDALFISQYINRIRNTFPVCGPVATMLQGRVTDSETGNGIGNVQVSILVSDVWVETETDSSGYYIFGEEYQLQPGVYTIEFSSPSYYDLSVPSVILKEGDNELNVLLVPIAIPGSVIEVTPDVYGVGEIWYESPGSGCSIEKVQLNGVEIAFDPDTGKYELFTVPQGQSCTIRVTANAWLTPKTGYWPSYGKAWTSIVVTAPDGTELIRTYGPLHSVNGHYETNKDTYTESWQWTADQIGVYEVLVSIRCVPYW